MAPVSRFDRFQPVIRKSYRFSRALKLVAVCYKGGPLPIGGHYPSPSSTVFYPYDDEVY
jgi:hypothetical protein